MKLRLSAIRHKQGVALVVTMVLGGIVGVLMLSYLLMIDNQDRSVARGQAWNKALVVAEAGVEEAMAQLNASGVTLATIGVNSWTTNSTGAYKTNVVGDSYSYVQIFTTSSVPAIVSTAYVPGPLGTPSLSRLVQVTCNPITSGGGNQSGAMVVSTFVNFNGQGITTDSFNSTNTALFPGGLYNAANAQDHGDVVSISPTNVVDLGNGTIKGSVHTPPGQSASVGASGVVGDMTYVAVAGNKGSIESGHAVQDMTTTSFPPATLPTNAFWFYPTAGSYKINGVTYKYLINSSLPYKFDSSHPLDGSVYFNGPDCTVWVTADIKLGSKDEIRIAGTSGSVNMYVDIPNAVIGGNGIVNETGQAKEFNYYG